MKSVLIALTSTILFIATANGQETTSFPKDPVTNKFTVSQVIDFEGKTRNEIFKAIRVVATQLAYSSSEKKEKDEIDKQMFVSDLSNGNVDSSRIIYKVQVTQVSTKNFKMLGYKSYMSLIMDMFLYVKDGKYKIELTNFTLAGTDLKLSGSSEAIEEKNSSNKNWNKMKSEMLADTDYVKAKIINNISTYFAKANF